MSSDWRLSRSACGFTLLELLMVMAVLGILTGAAAWCGKRLATGWQLKRAGHQVLEDLKATQGQAERSGSMSMSSGELVMQRTFMVFDVSNRSYEAYAWLDHNGDGVTDAGESTRLWQKSLPAGVAFDWAPGIDRRACSNVAGSPGGAVSFSSPAALPCDNRPCLKFDHHGFSTLGPGTIYLREYDQTMAISGTRPGHFTMCAWNGTRWH